MRSHQQKHLAEVLREYRERLERARKELDPQLDERGIPVHPIGEEMLYVESRMLDVENVLIQDAMKLAATERSLLWRARHWRLPRIGVLRHHRPHELVVPSGYLRGSPPQPAPMISIVTPSYQQGQFLERTIHSVLSQGYPELEYVVRDGGSSDETVEVLQRYESLLSACVSEPDGGQADAINKGFADTSGELMAYLNSDDLLLPGALAFVARYFDRHPDVDVLYGDRLMIDEHDRHIGSWVLPRHDDHTLTHVDYVPQETLFWRRKTWDAVGARIDADLQFALDWDLLLRMHEAGARIVHVPRFLGAFRVHSAQKTIVATAQCELECAQLRRRVHGHDVSVEQALVEVQPYLRRHIAHHTWHRFKARLPLPRTAVTTRPDGPAANAAKPLARARAAR